MSIHSSYMLHLHYAMARTAEIDINGTKYSIKKANDTASHASNVTINGVTYSISMARFSIPTSSDISSPMATYHVSTSQHSDRTGALIDHGANGGIKYSTKPSMMPFPTRTLLDGVISSEATSQNTGNSVLHYTTKICNLATTTLQHCGCARPWMRSGKYFLCCGHAGMVKSMVKDYDEQHAIALETSQDAVRHLYE